MSGVIQRAAASIPPGSITGGDIASETVTGGSGGNIALNTVTSENTVGASGTLCVAKSVECSGGTMTVEYAKLTITNGLITAIDASGSGCPI